MGKGQQEVKRINSPHVSMCHFLARGWKRGTRGGRAGSATSGKCECARFGGARRACQLLACVGASCTALCGFVALQECRSFLARRRACNNSRCAGLWRLSACWRVFSSEADFLSLSGPNKEAFMLSAPLRVYVG